jgi:hypothetical protein
VIRFEPCQQGSNQDITKRPSALETTSSGVVVQSVERLQTLTPTHPLLKFAAVPRASNLMMEVAHEEMNDAGPAAVASEAPQSPAYFMPLASWLERKLAGTARPTGTSSASQ